MKFILILTFFCASHFYNYPALAEETQKTQKSKIPQKKIEPKTTMQLTNQSRCIDDPKNPKLKCSKRTPAPKSQAQMNKPQLQTNQYSLNMDKKIKIFSTKIHEGLLLSQDCFKTKSPKCEAYTHSLKKPASKPEDNMKSPYHNNFAAIHCELIGGKGLIAKTFDGNDDDFCLFNDGSMVSSWSAYYKTNPPNQPATQKK